MLEPTDGWTDWWLDRLMHGEVRGAWTAVLLLVLTGCGGSQERFGTLPHVEVAIEKQPEQDPTLFREKKKTLLPPVTSDPPDPPPLRTTDHFDYVIGFNKGQVEVLSVSDVSLDKPESSPRRVGRFAFELWTGQQLVDRIRFDFPLLGATEPGEEDLIGKGLSTQTKIRVPASSRANRARILDRKTRDELEIPWPPQTSNAETSNSP